MIEHMGKREARSTTRGAETPGHVAALMHGLGQSRRKAKRIAALVLALMLNCGVNKTSFAQDPPPQPSSSDQNSSQGNFVVKVNAELVLTNVVARDTKTHELVHDLTQKDFTVYENGKQQQIAAFDFQTVDMATPLKEATVSGLAAGINSSSKAAVVARPEDLRNHRLIVMFFDLTSMQPEDLERSVDAARAFIKTKMSPADLVALGFSG